MSDYSIGALATLAHVSVRTLHFYDEIGLLQPSTRTEAGYRRYDQDDLLRLQQILFFRELDLPLKEIKGLLESEHFDPIVTLQAHREGLIAQRKRTDRLINMIDTTINQLQEDKMTLSDEELFAAFTPEQAESYQKEARERWGEERVAAVEARLRRLSKEEWQKVQEEGGLVAQRLAALMDHQPGDEQVQSEIARHHAWIENFYTAPAEVYLGLAQTYVDHAGFRDFYDQIKPGLAAFLHDAMLIFADECLA